MQQTSRRGLLQAPVVSRSSAVVSLQLERFAAILARFNLRNTGCLNRAAEWVHLRSIGLRRPTPAWVLSGSMSLATLPMAMERIKVIISLRMFIACLSPRLLLRRIYPRVRSRLWIAAGLRLLPTAEEIF